MNQEVTETSFNLERFTKVILIIGIIGVSIGIGIFLIRPEEEFPVFILLNEDGEMANYPVNASQNEEVTLYVFIDNQYKTPQDYMIKIYRGDNSTTINSMNGTKNALYIENITITLDPFVNWTSDPIDISFPNIGTNQTAIFELWKKNEGVWEFIPKLVIFIRLEIYLP